MEFAANLAYLLLASSTMPLDGKVWMCRYASPPFPKLRPKDEECGGGAYQLVVGVLWRFAPGTGYATSIGAFVVGRLGFAGSLGIDVLVVN